jgi:hypothetical protein
MGKLLPVPYPGQSMDEYREQLVNFQNNYWSFLKPSKVGSKFIPLPPLTLIKKTKEMSSRKLSEHVEDELFNKEKRATPKVDHKKVIKTTPKIVKESVLGQSEEQPVKKKKPYYRKRYKKPTPVEVISEPVKNKNYFAQGFVIGLVIGIVLTKLFFTFN